MDHGMLDLAVIGIRNDVHTVDGLCYTIWFS